MKSVLLDAVLAARRVTLCTQCAAPQEHHRGRSHRGVRIAGAPAIVEEITNKGVQALVY
jgi:hypothetical protein